MLILLSRGNAYQENAAHGTTTSSGTVRTAKTPVTYPQQRRQIGHLHKIGDHREVSASHAQTSTGSHAQFEMGLSASASGTTYLTGFVAGEVDVRTFRRRRDEADLLLLAAV